MVGQKNKRALFCSLPSTRPSVIYITVVLLFLHFSPFVFGIKCFKFGDKRYVCHVHADDAKELNFKIFLPKENKTINICIFLFIFIYDPSRI